MTKPTKRVRPAKTQISLGPGGGYLRHGLGTGVPLGLFKPTL